MKALCTVELGTEDACALEIKEIVKVRPEQKGPGALCFSASELKVAEFCYMSQSADGLMEFLGEFKVSTFADTMKSLTSCTKKSKVSVASGKRIKVECNRIGKHDYGSMDLAAEAGKILIESNRGVKACMNTPDLVFKVHIRDDRGYFGIDLAGKDLGKRSYKIFQSAGTIRGPLAYALLRFAGFSKGSVLVDPFCGAGTIPLEAGLFATGTSPHFFDKKFRFAKDHSSLFKKIDQGREKAGDIVGSDRELRHANSARKNAKIAGLEKDVRFMKCDVEWLDTKFDKSSVDVIVTNPPSESKHARIADLKRLYDEFFYQADFILKKKRAIVILCLGTALLEECAKKRGFKVVETKKIYSGMQELVALKVV